MADITLQSQILALIREGRGVVVEAAPDRVVEPRKLTPGEALDARVTAKLPDGRALIDVEGTAYQVKLPERADTAIGQRLSLTVIRPGAEPTFLLQNAPEATPASVPASEVRLSTLASRVATLLGQGSSSPGIVTAATASPEPLLAAAPTSGAALVAPLRKAVETSGMFYESHQAEWVGGRRPLEALRQEPQARVSGETNTAVVGSSRPADDVPRGAQSGARLEDGALSVHASRALGNSEPQALPPAIAGIVDRQLDALATQQIVWQGQVWPGQTMHWQVEEREGDGSKADEEAKWRTQLRLELPRLGAVTAQLDLNGDTLRVVIDAGAGAAVAASLRAGEPDLARMLEARGLRLGQLRVRTDGVD